MPSRATPMSVEQTSRVRSLLPEILSPERRAVFGVLLPPDEHTLSPALKRMLDSTQVAIARGSEPFGGATAYVRVTAREPASHAAALTLVLSVAAGCSGDTAERDASKPAGLPPAAVVLLPAGSEDLAFVHSLLAIGIGSLQTLASSPASTWARGANSWTRVFRVVPTLTEPSEPAEAWAAHLASSVAASLVAATRATLPVASATGGAAFGGATSSTFASLASYESVLHEDLEDYFIGPTAPRLEKSNWIGGAVLPNDLSSWYKRAAGGRSNLFRVPSASALPTHAAPQVAGEASIGMGGSADPSANAVVQSASAVAEKSSAATLAANPDAWFDEQISERAGSNPKLISRITPKPGIPKITKSEEGEQP